MTKKIKVILTFILIGLITGCGLITNKIVSTPGYLTSKKSIDKLDSTITQKLNKFGLNLYNEMYENGKNIFISPASIYLALGMTYNGADNNTAKEMASVLNASNLSLAEFNELSRDLQYSMLGYKNSKVELANSIWIRDTYSKYVKKDFIDRNKDYYGAMVASLDFDKESSINAINNWVKNNTKGRIEKIIEEDKINPLTMMYLINTIYFKADWSSPFEKEKTKDGIFNTGKESIEVKMMNKDDYLGYYEDNDLQGILKPYTDNKTAMFVLLPKKDIKDIDINKINDLLNSMKTNYQRVKLTMPKVKVEYTKDLNDSLKRLGMTDAFLDNADFSKMASNATTDGLKISKVTHKTFLSIYEKGTEAAAVTKVQMDLTAIPSSEKVMNINHPFIVGIVDKDSNAILFIGTVFDPTK